MEKVFENLKEEFNRKISTDSFISYFVKVNDVSREGSSSDSFEEISVDTSISPSIDSTTHSRGEHSSLRMHDTPNYDYHSEPCGPCVEDDEENIGLSKEETSSTLLNAIKEEEGNEQSRVIVVDLEVSVDQRLRNIVNEDDEKNISKNPNFQCDDELREILDGDDSNVTGPDVAQIDPVKGSPSNSLELPRDTCIQHEVSPGLNNIKKQSLHRMMWSEMPEVVESGILNSLSKKKIQLQEAMFEIIASEASYYQSLMILTSHFFESDLFKFTDGKERLVSPLDKHHIFSNVILIMFTSQNFLTDLDKRWRDEKPLLTQICDIILKHASGADFQNYVTYLMNQEYQNKALNRLAENEVFKHQLHKLERSSVCGKLSMKSYLTLPMQRLTRLKLLTEALLKLMHSEEMEDTVSQTHIRTAELTLDQVKQLLDNSDFEKGIMDQKSMQMVLMNRMDFPANFKGITISDKTFLKEDELKVHQQNPPKHIRKISKKRQPVISLILFDDLLIIAKKKCSRLLVLDYCDRMYIEVAETQYKSIVSSADVSNHACLVDLRDGPEDPRKMSVTSLARSKTSMSADDWRKFNSGLTNSFRSLSLTSRNDEHEVIQNSFTLKFIKSQTDIFSVPLVLLARDKEQRDEWVAVLGNYVAKEGRLHKTTSLKNNANRKDEFRLSKNLSLYGKRNETPP